MAISDAQYAAWLKEETAQRVMLVEAKYYADGAEHTAYLATMPYVSIPADSPANQPYSDAVLDTPKFTSSLGDALQGYTIPAWGDVVIDNSDFSRDAWMDYGWDGRAVSILFGDPSWPRTYFKPIWTGTISGISFPNSRQIKISTKDTQWALNTPIQSRMIGEPTLISGTTYSVSEDAVESIDAIYDSGTLLATSKYTTSPLTTPATFTLIRPPLGKLTVEYTGSSTAASGDVIPLCYGEVFNITPKCLSTALLIYQVHDGAINSIVEVRDNGVPIEFQADLATGKFTLLSKPVGTVTCDVQGATHAGTWIEGVGRIIRHVITHQTSLTDAQIDFYSLRTFINTCPQRAGIYINSRRNTLDVLDELIKSVGGFYTPDREGKIIFGRLDTPTVAKLTLNADDVVFGGLKLTNQSTPWQMARLAYLRNYTTQDSTHGAVSDADKAVFAHEWRYVTRKNPAIARPHLAALEPDAKQTCLVDRVEATTEATRLLALNGKVCNTYSIECITLPLTINLGDVVQLTHTRYGLASGKLLYVVGISESIVNRRVTLTLWG